MSNYTKSYNGAAKDAANSTLLGADFDTEFENIATAIATKANKVTSATEDGLAGLDVNGDLQDTGILAADILTTASDLDMDNAAAGILSIDYGGTGGGTAADARAALVIPTFKWMRCDSTGALINNLGVSSVTRITTGVFQVNFAVAYSSANDYSTQVTAERSGGVPATGIIIEQTTTYVKVAIHDVPTGSLINPTAVHVLCVS